LISDRLCELEPGLPCLLKAQSAFDEKGDLQGVRAAYSALPSSLRDEFDLIMSRIFFAVCARDFANAEEILSKSSNEEFSWPGPISVPRGFVALWLELVQGNHPTTEQFGEVREQFYQKVEADPGNPFLLTALALADVALGRTEESIQEAQRALEIQPISGDTEYGPQIAARVAEIYVWANQLDLAFEQLNILVQIPQYDLTYGHLKTYPGWDPLRKDPRFDKLLAELAPRD
jgi:tetratricopeptide (TPR) repeat protein